MHTPETQTEVQKLLDVLNSFPQEQQEALAAHYRAEAEHIRNVEARLDSPSPEEADRLRQYVQEGIDSGPAREIDFEDIKRRGRARLKALGDH